MPRSNWLVITSLLWLITLLVTIIVLAGYGEFAYAFVPLIVMYQGGHELQHGTFFRKRNGLINNFLGSLCYAIYFHNFELVRKSHNFHHKFGRMDLPNTMIDHPSGSFPRTFYYLGLLGLNYWAYIVSAPLWLVSKKAAKKVFGVSGLNLLWVVTSVLMSIVWFAFLLYNNSIFNVVTPFVIFSVYWGLIQNSAHYGLEYGIGDKYLYVARTYTVPRAIHFIFFGTPFSHFEHHVLPGTPGVLLNNNREQDKAKRVSCINPYMGYNLSDYVHHLFITQWKTPFPSQTGKWRN